MFYYFIFLINFYCYTVRSWISFKINNALKLALKMKNREWMDGSLAKYDLYF